MRAAILSVALAAAACSPYDPNLGPDPFLCGSEDPKCPDGYTAVNVTTVRCECHLTASMGGNNTEACSGFNADPLEPNDAQQSASPTSIGVANTGNFENLSICPGTDEDYFAMQIDKPGTVISVEVTFDAGKPTPTVDIRDPSGVSVGPTVTPGSAKTTATFTSRVSGVHFALVKAGSGLQPFNYSIHLKVTRPQ